MYIRVEKRIVRKVYNRNKRVENLFQLQVTRKKQIGSNELLVSASVLRTMRSRGQRLALISFVTLSQPLFLEP